MWPDKCFNWYKCSTLIIIIIIIIIIQQAAQCVHIFLRPFINYIIFFLQLCLSFQSSSTNPFSPISPLIPYTNNKYSEDLNSYRKFTEVEIKFKNFLCFFKTLISIFSKASEHTMNFNLFRRRFYVLVCSKGEKNKDGKVNFGIKVK
jgi:hypothetical protein